MSNRRPPSRQTSSGLPLGAESRHLAPDRPGTLQDATPSAPAGDHATPDLHLSAYLSEIGKPMRRLEGPPGRRVFVFANVTQADIAGFYSGARVSAISILGRLRDLKGLLMSQDGGRGRR